MVVRKKAVSPAIYIIPILAIINFLIIYLINLRVIEVEEYGVDHNLLNNGSSILQIIFILILATTLFKPRRVKARRKVKVRPKVKKIKMEDEEIVVVEPEYIEVEEPKIIDYPQRIDEGGAYSITMVPITKNEILRLRELMVKPCMSCDKQDECWEEIRGRVRFKDFRYNVDCKDGLGV